MSTNRNCSVANCGRNHNARGLCGLHYAEAKRTGTLPALPKRPTVKDRLNKYIKINPETGCHEWTSGKCDGYGLVWYDKGNIRAHRAAWITENGEIPPGKVVMHKCDNPSCINVDHLCLGTHADNSDDKVSKGRQARGERGGRAKLREQDVVAIRKDLKSSKASIARSYGISPQTVYDIKINRTWRHI